MSNPAASVAPTNTNSESSTTAVTVNSGAVPSSMPAGHETELSANIKNNVGIALPYSAIIEVVDPNGVTDQMYLQTWILANNSNSTFSAAWAPQGSGSYHITILVISQSSTPQILSTPIKSDTNVS